MWDAIKTPKATHRRRQEAATRALRAINSFEGSGLSARVLGYLRKLDPLAFEELLLSALEHRGALVLRNSRYTGDGGIDGRAYLAGVGWCAVQAKRYTGLVDSNDIDAFGSLVTKGSFAAGLFIHTGRSGAALARNSQDSRVLIISGERLVRLVCHTRAAEKT